MTLTEFDTYINSFLKKENYASDISLNGIQIQNSAPDSKEIKKIAFAVDACKETAELAVKEGADVLFVHHGLFWGRCQTVTGSFYERLSSFIKNDLALCAYHIPLDANNPYGNNYGLASRLGLKNCQEFGEWRGMCIGVKGELEKELTMDEIASKLMRPGKKPVSVLKFGKEKISTVGVISGGASEEVKDAIAAGLDCYITGEFAHEDFHLAKEMGMNVIAGGHYETETTGVLLIKEKVEKELGLKCTFLDVPTNL